LLPFVANSYPNLLEPRSHEIERFDFIDKELYVVQLIIKWIANLWQRYLGILVNMVATSFPEVLELYQKRLIELIWCHTDWKI